MKNLKISSLFIVFLALAIALPSFAVFAKAQDNSQASSTQATSSQVNGENHRSEVSKFVKTLLDIADREKNGIGEQVKAVAKQQDETKDTVADAIDKVKNRSGIKTFFIGTDYKNLGQLRSEMVKTENQIKQLNNLLEKTTSTEKTNIQNQLQVLEQEQQKIENFVKTNESKFSLFGWFTKLFVK